MKNRSDVEYLLRETKQDYSNLLEQSAYLLGYEGLTAESTNNIFNYIYLLKSDFTSIKQLPKKDEDLYEYIPNLKAFAIKVKGLIFTIDNFFKTIEGISGLDPVKELIINKESKSFDYYKANITNNLNYIINNVEVYYINNINSNAKYIANNLLEMLDLVYDLNTIKRFNLNLELIVLTYKEQDKQYCDFVVNKKHLISSVNTVLCIDNYTNDFKNELLQDLEDFQYTYNSSFLEEKFSKFNRKLSLLIEKTIADNCKRIKCIERELKKYN